MAEIPEDRLDEQLYRDEGWLIHSGGGFLHSNNVLFYFMQSPFFDRTSNNQSLFTQAQFNEDVNHSLATRETFEARLRSMQGLEFVVAHDPLQMAVQVPTPDGGTDWSNVWVIKKQDRRKRQGMPDEVTILAYYFIVNNGIYMAPSVGKVVSSRMLSTLTSLDKMLSAAAPLAMFSPARGHTYLPPTAKSTAQTGSARASKENTPMPDAQNQALNKAAKASINAADDGLGGSEIQNLRTLTESFSLSIRYGKEFMDDTPLTGEPGSFILSKSKDNDLLAPNQAAASTVGKSPFQAAASKDSSGRPTPPQIETNIASKRIGGKPGDKNTVQTPTSAKDRKRRKSKSTANAAG